MISRGEVALIVASKGASAGLMGSDFLGPIIIMVVVTTIVTPILLKLVFKKNEDTPVEAGKQVTSYYENADQYRGEARQKK